MLTVADKGGGGLSLADVSKNTKILANCFKSSVPYTMRETTALTYSPKLTTKYKINI